jgi:precorrin-2 dehydrogenase/sirohydrochlorin ferrochelatase
MKLLPIALAVENQLCLVAGGGSVAARKVAALLECGARVRLVSPQACEQMEPLLARVEYFQRAFEPDDCCESVLIFACTDNREVNAAIAREAAARNIWCNVADAARESTFHLSAAVRRGEICIGVNTSASSPALAKHLRKRIESCVGEEYSQLLELLGTRREILKARIEEQSTRAELWRRALESDALDLLRAGDRAAAEQLIDGLLASDPNAGQ